MNKCCENYTLEELKILLPHIPYYKIEIAYKYWHRSKNTNAEIFAINNNISAATLYRYVKDIKGSIKNG